MSLPTQIRQWETGQDGFENLKQTTAPMPKPGMGEVLLKIHTLSLNYRDTEVIMGLYTHHKAVGKVTSVVPCSDACGVVVELGQGISRWDIGDRCLSIFNQTHLTGQLTDREMRSGLGLPLGGTLCEYRVFSSDGLVKVPDYLSDEEACTLPIAGVTAWMALNWMRPLRSPGGKGQIVLIQGTGGVAIAGLQIAKASGAEVIVTSSSDQKLQRAKALGADHLINYRTTPNWEEKVLELTHGYGADVIFENGGAKTLRKSFDCVAWGGLIDCIGYLSGKEDDPDDRTNTNVLALKKNVTLKGIVNGPRDRFEDMLAFYDRKKIRPVVDEVFTFDQAKIGLEKLFHGGHFGKFVVKISE